MKFIILLELHPGIFLVRNEKWSLADSVYLILVQYFTYNIFIISLHKMATILVQSLSRPTSLRNPGLTTNEWQRLPKMKCNYNNKNVLQLKANHPLPKVNKFEQIGAGAGRVRGSHVIYSNLFTWGFLYSVNRQNDRRTATTENIIFATPLTGGNKNIDAYFFQVGHHSFRRGRVGLRLLSSWCFGNLENNTC